MRGERERESDGREEKRRWDPAEMGLLIDKAAMRGSRLPNWSGGHPCLRCRFYCTSRHLYFAYFDISNLGYLVHAKSSCQAPPCGISGIRPVIKHHARQIRSRVLRYICTKVLPSRIDQSATIKARTRQTKTNKKRENEEAMLIASEGIIRKICTNAKDTDTRSVPSHIEENEKE